MRPHDVHSEYYYYKFSFDPMQQGAGTICFNKSNYYKNTFPREILRDCISRRAGVLMHSKVNSILQSTLLTIPCRYGL